MTEPTAADHGLSVHRVEALTDGIYAVAMTLLVIELKLPDHGVLNSSAQVMHALAELWPKFEAWVISFFVLAFYWMGHYRAHGHMRRIDGNLVAMNLAQLAFVSLMPFSCALLGEHGGVVPQVVYALNMSMLSVFALLVTRYIHRHPELTVAPMSRGAYRGACVRIVGLILISVATVLIQLSIGETAGNGAGNVAFMLMALIVPLSRRIERASDRREALTPPA